LLLNLFAIAQRGGASKSTAPQLIQGLADHYPAIQPYRIADVTAPFRYYDIDAFLMVLLVIAIRLTVALIRRWPRMI
jgi:hypothetical protein